MIVDFGSRKVSLTQISDIHRLSTWTNNQLGTMIQSILGPSALCSHRPHSIGHKPFVNVQHSKARSAASRGVRHCLRTSCNAQTTEIMLKGDDVWSAHLMCICHCKNLDLPRGAEIQGQRCLLQGGAPLVETWEIQEGTELVSMPFSRPLGAVLAGYPWYLEATKLQQSRQL